MIEMKDLFAQYEIFQQNGPARTRLQAVLVVGNAQALIGGEMRHGILMRAGVGYMLVRFAAGAVRGFDLRKGHSWAFLEK